MSDHLGYVNALMFDRWTSRQLAKSPVVDALIAISGSSLRTGKELQDRGGVFFVIADRHINDFSKTYSRRSMRGGA